MNPDCGQPSYVIVTPAYNEALYIEKTIESVIAQTLMPAKWVIVDDGSTDATGEIIRDYADRLPWIEYMYRPKVAGQSYYGSNVYAIMEGLKTCDKLDYQYLAVLDADISLPKDYYQKIIGCLESDQKLGIASGVYVDRLGENRFRRVLNDRRSAPKALMVFRRSCYEEVGGFVPMKYGGEDTVACCTARMKGWKTWSFPDMVAVHNKPVGTGHSQGMLRIRFRQGQGEYFLAAHPLFMVMKCLRRCMKEPPYLIGGCVRLSGFVYAHFSGEKRQLSDELIRFIRQEQFLRVTRGNRVPGEYQVTESV